MTKDTEALREALAKCRHQFQSYATEHKAKSDAAYKAWDDARYWGNVDEQDAAHKEYHKRLTQTQTNEALVAMIDAALDPDTIGSHFGNGGGFDPSAELGFDPTAEVGDEVFPHDAGESAPVAWMLRSNETGEVIFDEVCVWRDRESAEDAVAEIDPELMEYSADAVPFPLYAHPPHPAPADPVGIYVTPDSIKAESWDIAENFAKARGYSGILEAMESMKPVDSAAGGEADTIIAKLDFKMLREAVSGIADDWMSSKEHHQGWVLIPIDKFSKLRVADRIMKMRGNNAALATPATNELGFDPTAEVGDEVFPHDTIGSHFGNGGGLDPVAGGEAWTCAARKQGSAGGNDPADCDWPFCGCDPYADKVLAVVEESALAALKGPAA